MSRFIVVGAGAFGVSTALHLARDDSNAEIHLFNLPPKAAQSASTDINKVVRAEYPSDLYRALAEEAMIAWKHEDFERFYHKPGWVIIHGNSRSSLPRPPLENKRMTEEEFRQRFDAIYKGCEVGESSDITYDDSIAWVEAAKALEGTIWLACEAGVIYRTEEVSELYFKDGRCTGVYLKSGEQLHGFTVILAMGPWTGPFIARHSQLHYPHGLFVNAGVSTAIITLDEDEALKYRQMPILVRPAQGEIMPLDKNRQIKVTNARSFTNDRLTIQGPIAEDRFGSQLFDENRALLAQFLPQFKDKEFSNTWFCYDCITPNQDFLICPVPQTHGLYVAAGGSFHGFKFLPIIGKYVVQMIRGVLDPELARRWQWDRSERKDYTDIHGDVIPRRILEPLNDI